MKLLPLLLLIASPVAAQNWAPVAQELSKSVVYINNTGGSCTGFVINAEAKDKDDRSVDYVLTAAHCDGEELLVAGEPVRVVHKDVKKDLLVLEVDDLDRPALKLAKQNPLPGEQVASLGYGYGLDRPLFRTTTISDDNTYIPEDGIGGPLMVIDAAFVGGQSGGPVVNAAGEVVMIVQMSDNKVGLGVGAEMIRGKVGRYFSKPVK